MTDSFAYRLPAESMNAPAVLTTLRCLVSWRHRSRDVAAIASIAALWMKRRQAGGCHIGLGHMGCLVLEHALGLALPCPARSKQKKPSTACPMTDLAIKQCRVWRLSESVMPSNAVVPSQLCLLTPYALLSRTATDGPASSGLSQHAMNSRFSLLNIQHVSCIHECGVKLAGKTCFLPTETNGLTGNSMGIQVPGSRRTASQSGHPVLAICRPCH